MKKFHTRILLVVVVGLLILSVSGVHATDDETLRYDKAQITVFTTTQGEQLLGYQEEEENFTVTMLSGPEKGKSITIVNNNLSPQSSATTFAVGDTVIVLHDDTQTENEGYSLVDHDRTMPLAILFLVFLGMVIVFSQWRGISALMGLGFSIVILAQWIVPAIMNGTNPVLVSLLGALVIAVVSITVGHGYNRRTRIAVVSTLVTVLLAGLFATLSVSLAHLFGLGSEEAFYAQFEFSDVNFRGLLIGGMIIGALGILDDVTTAQTAAIEEIYKANSRLSFHDLYKRGISVGKEHIVSLVNTIALAYAGASLPLFLLFAQNNSQPLWVVMSSEFISEEIVRTLVGSMTLVLAVPISTLLAAYMFTRQKGKISR